ncbi:Hypothetical protein HDN1F_12140 [gamma proteobacterium HdN1]|nr:Hypothetical protein HDN1F_12140 [gamma proteobacterium HdN1]
MNRISLRLLTRTTSVWAAHFLLIVTLAGCSMLPFGKPAPAIDPALDDDPAAFAEFEQNAGNSLWEWNDTRQRWHYTIENTTPPRLAQDAWPLDEGAIQLRILAAPQSNLHRGRPHALIVRVIQMSDAKPFQVRRDNLFGLKEMLTVNDFDKTAVLSVNDYSILPGSEQMLTLDRLENSRYIGIVAGFFELNGRQSARLIAIPPTDTRSTTKRWIQRLSFGFFGAPDASSLRAARLKILLQIGTDKIDSLRIRAD